MSRVKHRWLGISIMLATVAGAASALVIRRSGHPDEARPADPSTVADPPTLAFVEVPIAPGTVPGYRNGEEAGELTILESLGGGVAIFDYDGDGLPDLYFPGGGRFVTTGETFTVEGLPGRLLRNEGGWRFRDVTGAAGLDGPVGYSHGATTGDYDGDGDPDLLVTTYEGVILYRNEGGSRFVDVTEEAGLAAPGWSTAAAWADVDGDGRLDLYVARYVDWSPAHHPECRYQSSGRVDVCSPSAFNALSDALYRNAGDGTFVDVTRTAGILEGGKGLGVVAADLDGDLDVDLYVTNDTTPNALYRNRGDGTFDEVGQLSGAALSAEGVANGSMGVAVVDADDDGDLDLWVSNYEGETNELYRNDGDLWFVPVGMSTGLGARSRPLVGWGTCWADFENDGRPECLVVNGHLMHHLPGSPMPQPALLFRREGDSGRFGTVDGAGPYFNGLHQARGCAVGDLDLDGDPDLVIVHQNGPPALLRNDPTVRGSALRLRLEGVRSNRSAVGAAVTVTAGGRSQLRQVIGGGSYLSQSEARLLVGLGQAERADRVEVRWPSGAVDVHRNVPAGTSWLLREGDAPRPDVRPTD